MFIVIANDNLLEMAAVHKVRRVDAPGNHFSSMFLKVGDEIV